MNMFDYLRSKGVDIEEVETLELNSAPNCLGSINIGKVKISFLFKNKSYDVVVNLNDKKYKNDYKNDYRLKSVKILRTIINKIKLIQGQ